jgi:hypothetical protein
MTFATTPAHEAGRWAHRDLPGFLLITLDATIVNVALGRSAPTSAGASRRAMDRQRLHAHVRGTAAVGRSAGRPRRLAHRVSRRLAIFAAGSAACGSDLADRAHRGPGRQGAGAAALMPCSLALYRARLPGNPRPPPSARLWAARRGSALRPARARGADRRPRLARDLPGQRADRRCAALLLVRHVDETRGTVIRSTFQVNCSRCAGLAH